MDSEEEFKNNLYNLQRRLTFGARNTFSRKLKVFLGSIIIGFFLILFLIVNSFLPPKNFPNGQFIEIPEGISIASAGNILESAGAIKSKTIFQTFVIILSKNKGVRAGIYSFSSPESVISIASKLANGTYGIARLTVTFPEGISVNDMADVLGNEIPMFDKQRFIELGQIKEGFLFPDSYFFFQTVLPDEVIETMSKEFNEKIKPYELEIADSPHTLKQIITMASIIERETNGKSDYEMISGILWNRLAKHMRLEVDATSLYKIDNGKINAEDIKNEPSSYNTYNHDGLPPTPIGNPGIKAIEAALRPAKTDYLFYLHSDDGTIHYARTFTEHQQNINKYLR